MSPRSDGSAVSAHEQSPTLLAALQEQLLAADRHVRESAAYPVSGACLAMSGPDGSFAFAALTRDEGLVDARLAAVQGLLQAIIREDAGGARVQALLEKARRCLQAAGDIKSGEALASRSIH